MTWLANETSDMLLKLVSGENWRIELQVNPSVSLNQAETDHSTLLQLSL